MKTSGEYALLATLTICFAMLAVELKSDTNTPPKLESTAETVLDAKTMTWKDLAKDTNAVMALPYVQQALHAAWSEGAQFGVSASINNRTLVQMQDAAGLYKAAMFLRFGGGAAK